MNNTQYKIYLYCIAETDNPENFSVLSGLENNYFIKIVFKDICFIAEQVQTHYMNIKRGILIHEKVIENIMQVCDVLPMRFNSIIKDENSALDILEKNYSKLKANLKKVSGKAEYGIKIIWNYDKILQNAEQEINKDNLNIISGSSQAKEYLRNRLKKYKIDSFIEKEADKFIEKFISFFVNINHNKVIKKLQTEKLVLNASFLIYKNDEPLFKKACLKLKNSYEKDFNFLFSGPWPPYNFIDSVTF